MSETNSENLRDVILELKKEITDLRIQVSDLQKTCGRMDGHITFVERVYEMMRYPLKYLIGNFNAIESEKELPALTQYVPGDDSC